MGIKKRKSRNMPERDRILIVCQGKETERNYLEKMREHIFTKTELREKVVIKIEVNSNAPDDIVNCSIGEMKSKKNEGYNQVWCVFDKDEFPDIHKSIARAKAKGVKVAYSNKCFELWIFLHFAYTESAMNADQLFNKVDTHFLENFGKDNGYCKNDGEIYDKIVKRQDAAIKNAKKLLSYHGKKNIDDSNPSTTVHLLIEELRERKRVLEGLAG